MNWISHITDLLTYFSEMAALQEEYFPDGMPQETTGSVPLYLVT